MNEFVYPTYGEWFEEFRQVTPADAERLQPPALTGIFGQVSQLLRSILELPARRDYYEPERAALVLETLHHLPAPVKHGGVAYATWMTKLADDRFPQFLPTSLMGAEICRGVLAFQKEFDLPDFTARYIREVLKLGIQDAPASAAGQLVREWMEEGQKRPFATWLRDRAIARAAGD